GVTGDPGRTGLLLEDAETHDGDGFPGRDGPDDDVESVLQGLGGELVISAHPVRQFGDQVGFVHVGIPLRVRYAGAVPVRAELNISILTWFRHTGVFRRLLRNDFLSHDQRGVVTGLNAGRR